MVDNFKIGDRVRVKPTANFGGMKRKSAFHLNDYEGKIVEILHPHQHLANIRVDTFGETDWFTAQEIMPFTEKEQGVTDKNQPRVIGTGMPQSLYLGLFGRLVNDAFGSFPYLVGSASASKQWRDVDVRLILADEEYERLIGGDPGRGPENPRWRSLCMAFAELGRHMTGLPIDFQIQQQSYANKTYPNQIRQALIGFAEVFSEPPERK